MKRRGNKGMTLVELMIVVAILAILASISIMTYVNTRKHAVATEAIVGLSSLKQAMKQYYVEYDKYQELDGFLDPDDAGTYPGGLNPGFLDGEYFQDTCYKIETAAGKIKCFPMNSQNPVGQKLADGDDPEAYIALYLTGSFVQHNVSCTGYRSE